jgi:hypothetical protein
MEREKNPPLSLFTGEDFEYGGSFDEAKPFKALEAKKERKRRRGGGERFIK